MDTKQQICCGKRKKKSNLNIQESQNDYFSIIGLQTYSFVKQSKENCKNLDGLRRLRKSTKIGLLLQNFWSKVFIISNAIILLKSILYTYLLSGKKACLMLSLNLVIRKYFLIRFKYFRTGMLRIRVKKII